MEMIEQTVRMNGINARFKDEAFQEVIMSILLEAIEEICIWALATNYVSILGILRIVAAK
jgi:hypothetical protein